jgi:hypothetical protein
MQWNNFLHGLHSNKSTEDFTIEIFTGIDYIEIDIWGTDSKLQVIEKCFQENSYQITKSKRKIYFEIENSSLIQVQNSIDEILIKYERLKIFI